MLNPRYLVHTYPDLTALNQAAATYWVEQATQAIAQRAAFHVALTGGSTPQPLYRLLATPEVANKLDWNCVHIYIGDERYVPHDHPDSNYGMVKACMLDQIAIPPENLHPIPTQYEQAHDAAADYAEVLSSIASKTEQVPELDLIMLGMGEDGHTASLFPGTDILQVTDKTVAAVYVEKLASWRVSMTYPTLNRAKQVMVLVSGEGKADILAHILQKDSETLYPIQSVSPAGEMHWFLDQAAAGKLDQSSS